jgi:hypothetical protein
MKLKIESRKRLERKPHPPLVLRGMFTIVPVRERV